MENISVHQRRFEAAAKVMRNLPANGLFVPSDAMLLTFHTYHRQATVGPCDTTDPHHPAALSKTEWAAWKALGDMSKEEAMKAYVEEILLILEMIPVTEEVCDLLKVLEPFYEVVEDEDEDKDDDTTSKPAMSTFSGSRSSVEEEEEEEDDDDVDRNHDAADVTRLTVANRAERGGSPVCSSSISSLSKTTHSSINTYEEEEEPEHSLQTSRDSPERFLQLLTDDGDDVSEPEESSEVYSDLVRWEEGSGGLQAAAAPAKELEGRGPSTEGVSQDGRPHGETPPPFCRAAHETLQSVMVSAEGRGCELAGDSLAPVVTSMKVGENLVNTQIVVALSRLQDDMRSVLAKLDKLEARAMSQVERFALRSQTRTALDNKRRPVCQISAAFLLAWPFVAHFLVQLYFQKKRKMKL
ncbi:acyl-CoA-binding domain-containing protein 5-B isoform X2 [Silurus meridionalis]|uniref:acyl-CoA-binding domain-containing protein 5-B isoform X2 n=1 Tax=Silurus meridionalis TaxID=175797 RepID=UPI001EEA33A6|nr:acyl-CoA-binding domain-containing protein 5-B isoform X2 [Silurus meridionalis]